MAACDGKLRPESRGRPPRLANMDERGALGNNATDELGAYIAALEGCARRVSSVAGNGHQQSSRGLRVEEQVAILLRDRRGKAGAVANEIAIVFQAAGKVAFAGSFHRAGQVLDARVIQFE